MAKFTPYHSPASPEGGYNASLQAAIAATQRPGYQPLATDDTWRSWLERCRAAVEHYTHHKPSGWQERAAFYRAEAYPYVLAGVQAEQGTITEPELLDVLIVFGIDREFSTSELAVSYRELFRT
jgi:hypothetical protein